MTPSRLHKVEDLFTQLSALPAQERDGRLAAACGNDTELLLEVKRLLQAPVSSDWEAALRGDALAFTSPPELPETIGPYRIADVIGSGGYSTVYLGYAAATRAAVKVLIQSDSFSHKRFLDERLILEALAHPYIPKLIGSGTHDGDAYIAMEYVPGPPITTFTRQHRLDLAARVRLMSQVCEAVHAAHVRGVIHRDLKPGNILVVDGPGGPEPRLIDFGIAQASEALGGQRSAITKLDHVIGSEGYMPPEQLSGGNVDIDRRLDVYALGAVLYELITGRPPLPPTATVATEGAAAEAARPSELLDGQNALARELLTPQDHAAIERDLDWVALKALKPRRADRYTDAAELAADLNRFLNRLPVRARPPSFIYVAGTYARKHWRETALVTTLAAALIAGAVGISALYARTRWISYVDHIGRAQQLLNAGNTPDALTALKGCPHSLQGWEYDLLDAATTPTAERTAGFRHALLQPMPRGGAVGLPSPNGLIELETASLKPVAGSAGVKLSRNKRIVAWSPASLRAVGITDTELGRDYWTSRLDAPDAVIPLQYPPEWGMKLTWSLISTDQQWIAVSSWNHEKNAGFCSLYDAVTGELKWQKEDATIGGFDGEALLISTPAGVRLYTPAGVAGSMVPALSSQVGRWSISRHASGVQLFTATGKQAVLFDASMGRRLVDAPGRVGAAAISPDGSILAVADGMRLRLFSVTQGFELPAAGNSPSDAVSLGFSDNALVVGCVNGECESFDLAPLLDPAARGPDRPRTPKLATERTFELADAVIRLQADGKNIRCERRKKADAAFTTVATFPGKQIDAAAVNDSGVIAVVAVPGEVYTVNLTTGSLEQRQPFTAKVRAVAVEPAGKRVAIGTITGNVQVATVGGRTTASVSRQPVTALAWASDDRILIATAAGHIEVCRDDLASIMSLATPEVVENLEVTPFGLRATGASKKLFYWRLK